MRTVCPLFTNRDMPPKCSNASRTRASTRSWERCLSSVCVMATVAPCLPSMLFFFSSLNLHDVTVPAVVLFSHPAAQETQTAERRADEQIAVAGADDGGIQPPRSDHQQPDAEQHQHIAQRAG